jgi:neutral trehalase
MACWREAWRLRREHPRWVVIWVAQASQYRAYRLSRAQRESVLAADTPAALAAQIEQAEQAERAGRKPGRQRRASSTDVPRTS